MVATGWRVEIGKKTRAPVERILKFQKGVPLKLYQHLHIYECVRTWILSTGTVRKYSPKFCMFGEVNSTSQTRKKSSASYKHFLLSSMKIVGIYSREFDLRIIRPERW